MSNLRPENFPVLDDEKLAIEADQDLVTVARFSEVSGDVAELLAKHFGSAVAPGLNRLAALHYALLRNPVVVHVPADVELATPVRIRRTFASAQFAAPHTLIVTGANSRVTIVQEYFSGEDEMFHAGQEDNPRDRSGSLVLHHRGAKNEVFEPSASCQRRDARSRAQCEPAASSE